MVDLLEDSSRLLLKTLQSAGGLEQLSAAHEAVSAYHGNNYLPLLEGFYRSHRPALFTLVDSLRMTSTTAERSVLDAVEFVRANRDRRSEWIEPAGSGRGGPSGLDVPRNRIRRQLTTRQYAMASVTAGREKQTKPASDQPEEADAGAAGQLGYGEREKLWEVKPPARHSWR